MALILIPNPDLHKSEIKYSATWLLSPDEGPLGPDNDLGGTLGGFGIRSLSRYRLHRVKRWDN